MLCTVNLLPCETEKEKEKGGGAERFFFLLYFNLITIKLCKLFQSEKSKSTTTVGTEMKDGGGN